VSRIIRSPEKQIQHKKKMRILSVVAFFCVGIFAWLVIYIPSLDSLQIKDIIVRGNKVLTEADIKQKAEEELSGKYFYVFPQRNIFWYPKDKVLEGLRAAFPRIASVSAELDTERILTVTLTEREPFALWCGREIEEVEADACAYLDDQGFVFAKAPHFSGNIYFEFYGKGLLPDGDPAGHNFLPPVSYQHILQVKEELESFQVHPIKIFVAEDGGAFFTEVGGYGIRFNVDQDVSVLKSNMQAVFHSSSWGDIARSNALEYLDFRFGNKVYYKYKNKELIQSASTTAKIY
jgi:hypothetical protein